jgi:phage terminase large subunit-like protein
MRLNPPFIQPEWAILTTPRADWLDGVWDYARGKGGDLHPDYAQAVEIAYSQGWNPWWIRTVADVDAVVNHGCWFSEPNALRVCEFFRKWIRVSKGAAAGKPIPLIDWQVYDFLAPLYGWRRADGRRRFTRGGLWIAKKNGKSTLSSGLALYHLMRDGEAGPEVYTAAGDRAQASIIYDEASRMAKACDAMASRLRFINSKKTITYTKNAGKFSALSAEATLHEGINASLILFDELHVQKSRVLWDTLAGSQIAREQPLFLSMSTAGVYDPLCIGWEEWQRGQQIREGSAFDPSFFSLCYTAGEKADANSVIAWKRANPSLNCTVYEDNLKEIHLAAQVNSAKMDQFKRYHLNIWVRGFNRWMDMAHWNGLAEAYTADDLAGMKCYGGLDLASTNDINALVLLFPGEVWRILCYFWLPEENISELQDQHAAPYDEWHKAGLLNLTEGNRCNYQEIRADINELAQKFKIEEIRFDPYNASNLVSDLADDGLVMVEQSQGKKSLSPPTKSLEIAIMRGEIVHNANPIMDWMMGNVQVTYDLDENIKMVKAFRNIRYKIDGPVALVMAHAGATCEENYYSNSTQGLVII